MFDTGRDDTRRLHGLFGQRAVRPLEVRPQERARRDQRRPAPCLQGRCSRVPNHDGGGGALRGSTALVGSGRSRPRRCIRSVPAVEQTFRASTALTPVWTITHRTTLTSNQLDQLHRQAVHGALAFADRGRCRRRDGARRREPAGRSSAVPSCDRRRTKRCSSSSGARAGAAANRCANSPPMLEAIAALASRRRVPADRTGGETHIVTRSSLLSCRYGTGGP